MAISLTKDLGSSMRICRRRLNWLLAGLLVYAGFLNVTSSLFCLPMAVANETEIIAEGEPRKVGNRAREGTEFIDVPGYFKLTGDRATFYPLDGSGRYSGLENQSLERVANVIGDDPMPLEWLVSGTITEYRGSNYILVTRAILKSKPSVSKVMPGKRTMNRVPAR